MATDDAATPADGPDSPLDGPGDAETAETPGTADPATTPETAAKAPTPAPRPRSATSRARRIGGVAAARPGDESTAADPPAAPGKPGAPKAGTKAGTKAGAKADAKSDAKADAKADGKSDGKSAAKSDAKADPKRERKNGAKVAGAAATTAKVDTSKKKTPAADDPPPSSRGSVTLSIPGWVRWAPAVVFAAVAVVFLTLFVVARVNADDPPASTSSAMRQEVLAAAKTCLATLNTYRYNQLDAAEAAGAKCTTGKLTTDFKQTVSTVIRKNAPPLKAVQIAKINAAGIEQVTANGKQWTILAYGQLNITTSNTGKQGRIDPFAVVARMQKVQGKWVLSKVDTVSSLS